MSFLQAIIVGDIGSGKSSSSIRFVQDMFISNFDPTIEDSYRKQIEINGEQHVCEILDTVRGEEYLVHEQWVKISEGFIFLFALNSRKSFDKICDFYKRITLIKKTTNIPCVLIGNKCDLTKEIQVPTEDIEELANIMNCTYYIASAKENININDSFMDCCTQIIMYKENRTINEAERRKK